MDIFIPQWSWDAFVLDMEALGFESLRVASYSGPPPPSVDERMTMMGLRPGQRIHLHQTRDAPDEAIAHFPITLLMNLIAYNHLSVAYPNTTLRGIGVLHPMYTQRPDAYRIQGIILKYVQRDYRICYPIRGHLHLQLPQNPPSIHCLNDLCPRRMRSFYDQHSMRVVFGADDLEPPRRAAHWNLGGFACCNTCESFALSNVDVCDVTCVVLP